MGPAKKKPKDDPKKPAPKVKEPTYEIVRHVNNEELEQIKKAGGKIVLHYNSEKKARWINIPTEQYKTGTVNPDPKNNIHRVTYTVRETGFKMLDNTDTRMAQNFWATDYEGGETGAPEKVLYKGNEKGVRGIGVDVLKEFNNEIVSAKYETRVGNSTKYSSPKIILCKGEKR
ncbi:hypothetical protein [Xenorhabdus bovienii]|uniref:hypothetical protein n=1 Tax=Xenorhabdus bovienii TaxID=40576 RepID=UPI003DA3FB98